MGQHTTITPEMQPAQRSPHMNDKLNLPRDVDAEETKVSGRFSVSPNDSGYSAFRAHGAFSVKWRVLLNGHEVPHAVMADTERGEIVAALIKDGHPLILAGVIAQETLYGSVEVFIK